MTPECGHLKDSFVVCQSNQGAEVRGQILSLSRFKAVFEVYNPSLVLRAGEVLGEFRVIVGDRSIYSGRSVVQGVVTAGVTTVCETGLEENAWRDIDFTEQMLQSGTLLDQFRDFIGDWQRVYRLAPEYKVVIADMETYLSGLRLWLDQVEIGIRAAPSGDRLQLENQVAAELARPIIPCVNALFDRFERVAATLEEDSLPVHRNYMRRQLHPLVLCSPFAYRTFQKPLGYAGDYEMVNMMLREEFEGGSLFAKVVNLWFLRQPPAEAHRNRINYLVKLLENETVRTWQRARPTRVLSLACGPAQEVQNFVLESHLSNHTHFTLIDFNEETLEYARRIIDGHKQQKGRQTTIEYVRKSVQQVLKESGRSVQSPERQYDLVYCAGLFDYLSNQICSRLMDVMYDWVAPDGLLVATNVEPSNPLRHGMEHLLDWHLIYRTAAQMATLAPTRSSPETTAVISEATGVNLFLETRKLGDA